MKLVFLDAKTIGSDIDLSAFEELWRSESITTFTHLRKHLHGLRTLMF